MFSRSKAFQWPSSIPMCLMMCWWWNARSIGWAPCQSRERGCEACGQAFLSAQRKTPEWNEAEKIGGNMASFFQVEGGLPEKHPAYILRRKVDDEALRVAVQGRLFQVIAPRQVGKTSLLYHLRWRLQEQGWRCVVIDLARLRNFRMAVWYETLGRMLAAGLTPGLPLMLTNHLTLFEYLTGEAMYECYGSPQVAIFFDAVENALSARDEQG